MRNSIFISLIATILSLGAGAQLTSKTSPNGAPGGETGQMAQLRTDMLAHSPEAEGLGKFGVLPMTLYTGMPQVSIPLYELKTPSLSLSFALTYHYNGHRPAEVATWAGLGWTLQGGGVITRVVNGMQDEITTAERFDNYVSVSYPARYQEFLVKVGKGLVDGEPDIYVFNVGAYSGKFILVKNRAYIFPHQNLNITRYGTDGFKLVDDKGNTYLFTDKETTFGRKVGDEMIPTHTSAWYVSKITSANKQDEISFQYESYNYKMPSQPSDSYTISYGDACTGGNNSGCHSFSSTNVSGDRISALYLTKVYSRYGSIRFLPGGTPRQDLPGTTAAYPLQSVVISGGTGSGFHKKFNLIHSYFEGGPLRLDAVNVDNPGSTVAFDAAMPTTSSYKMEYETGAFLPSTSRSIDIYGFANGASNGCLFEVGSITNPLVALADRKANPEASKAGIMKRLTFPTGGYTDFEWEQNQVGHQLVTNNSTPADLSFTNYYQNGPVVNGAVLASRTFTLNKAQTVVIDFGTLSGQAVPYSCTRVFNGAGQLLYSAPVIADPQYSGSASLFLPAGDYRVETESRPGNTSVINANVNYAVYDVENTLADGPGLRVRRINSYDRFHGAGQPSLVKEYAYSDGILAMRGAGSGSTTDYVYLCGPDINGIVHRNYSILSLQAGSRGPISTLAGESFFYKKVTETSNNSQQTGRTDYRFDMPFGESSVNSYSRGLLEVKEMGHNVYRYDGSSYVPVSETQYQYKHSAQLGFNAMSLEGVKAGVETALAPLPPRALCFDLPSPDWAFPSAYVKRIYGIRPDAASFFSQYSVLTQEKNIAYDENGIAGATDQTDYYYDNPDHQQPTRIVTKNSKGEELVTELKYPLDYHWVSITRNGSTINSLNKLHEYVNSLYSAAKTGMDQCYENLRQNVNAISNGAALYSLSPQQQSSYLAVLGGTDCLSAYKVASANAFTERTATWNAYDAALRNAIVPTNDAWKNAILSMQADNIVTPVIEKYVSIKRADGSEVLLSAIRNEYAIQNGSVVPAGIRQVEMPQAGLLKTTFLAAPETYYKAQVSFTFDKGFHLTGQNKINDLSNAYAWSPNWLYPTAQALNCPPGELFYDSFEDGMGWDATNLSYDDLRRRSGRKAGLVANSSTSTRSAQASNWLPISQAGARKFRFSAWVFSNGPAASLTLLAKRASETGAFTYSDAVSTTATGQWVRLEKEFLVPADVTLLKLRLDNGGVGNTWFDDVQLAPATARVTTYTYDRMNHITTQTDENGRSTFYEYDAQYRLILVRDQDGNIVKRICYNYFGETEVCDATTSSDWQATGERRCQLCSDGIHLSGVEEIEVQDVNPLSQTYQRTDWVVNPNGSCVAVPDWQPTGELRCAVELTIVNPDGSMTPLYNGYQERKELDMNPCSNAAPRWTLLGQNCASCPVMEQWAETSRSCEKTSGGENTGNQLIEEVNIEACSSSPGALRIRSIVNTESCPMPYVCTGTNCTGPGRKCINNVCEYGTPVCVSSVRQKLDGVFKWICTWQYCFSDGTIGGDSYTTESDTACPLTLCL